MSDGQEKSPFSDSLATEENGLGIENLNQRLQRYAGAKSRALDMANYIKTEDVSNNENRKLVKKTGRLCIVSRIQALLHRKQGDFAWHENLSSAAIVSVLCAS